MILDITSTDVLHTWWVRRARRPGAAPGDVTRTWFKADEEGRYPPLDPLDRLSGTGYPAMRAWVRGPSVPDYQAHIERLQTDLAEAQGIVQQTQEEQSTSESAIREEGE